MASKGSGVREYEKAGFEILVGKGARDNDHLTFRIAAADDVWMHAAGYAGSHVVIRNPRGLRDLPRDVLECAAQLAAFHSKAREARGKIEVHVCRAADVRKPRGFPAGKVEIKRWESTRTYPRDPFAENPD